MNEYPERRREAQKPKDEKAVDRLSRGVMHPPRWLDRRARSIFKELATELNVAGVVRRVDSDVLAEYSQARSDAERLVAEIRKAGDVVEGRRTGEFVANPLHRLLRDARNRVKQWGDRLGLSPKARNGVIFPRAEAVAPDEKTHDQMELFFRGEGWNQHDPETDRPRSNEA
jgi:P27 family predicted phage terminase small subunit